MTIFDTVLLLFWAGFVFYGLFFGLIRVVGSIAGVIVGAIGTYYFYLDFYNLIKAWFFGLDNIGKIVSAILLFGIINKVVGLIFAIVDKTYNIISILPFLKSINRIGGAILGLLQGGLVLGLLLYILSRYQLFGLLSKMINDSVLYPFLIKIVSFVLPMFSSAVGRL